MESFYLQATDGHKIPVYLKKAENEKFTVQIVHGLFDTSDRYFDMCSDLNKFGGTVAIMDIRGHKKSVSNADESLYLGEYNGWNNAVDDIHILNTHLTDMGKPNFLIGFGMGSDLLRTFAIKYGYSTDGIILVSPSQYIGAIKYNIFSKIIGFLISNKTGRYRSKKLKEMTLKKFNKYFDENNPFSYVTSDENELNKINNNQFMEGIPTVAMWRSYLLAKKKLQDENASVYIPNDLPLLLVCGSKDAVGGGVKKQKDLVDFYSSIGKDATLMIIDGGRFDLYHDNTKETFLRILEEFFEKHISQNQTERNS